MSTENTPKLNESLLAAFNRVVSSKSGNLFAEAKKLNEVSATEIMNSDLYKKAVKGRDPNKIQIGDEIEGLGKFKEGETIWSKTKAALEAQKAAPVPRARNARPETVQGSPVPVAKNDPVPAAPKMAPQLPAAAQMNIDKADEFRSAAAARASSANMQPQRDPTVPPVSVGPTPNYPTADKFVKTDAQKRVDSFDADWAKRRADANLKGPGI